MKNILKREIEKLEEETDVSLGDRADRNRQIIAAYYEPVKRTFPARRLVCALCSVVVIAAAGICAPFIPWKTGDVPAYQSQGLRAEISMEELSSETGLYFSDTLGGYSFKAVRLYYEEKSGRTLAIEADYTDGNGGKFSAYIVRDKSYAKYIVDYVIFEEATQPIEAGGKEMYAVVIGNTATDRETVDTFVRYETETTYVGLYFSHPSGQAEGDPENNEVGEGALRVLNEIVGGKS